jgi:hypothetical protein
MTLDDVKIIELPRIFDERGNLSFIEGGTHIPFSIKRSYWIYDVPGGEKRGGHAYRILNEFIVALSGSFDVVLDDGHQQRIYPLNRSYYGIYVPAMIWRSLENFSTNSLCMILASDHYNDGDYIMEYDTFRKMKQDG